VEVEALEHGTISILALACVRQTAVVIGGQTYGLLSIDSEVSTDLIQDLQGPPVHFSDLFRLSIELSGILRSPIDSENRRKVWLSVKAHHSVNQVEQFCCVAVGGVKINTGAPQAFLDAILMIRRPSPNLMGVFSGPLFNLLLLYFFGLYECHRFCLRGPLLRGSLKTSSESSSSYNSMTFMGATSMSTHFVTIMAKVWSKLTGFTPQTAENIDCHEK